MNTKGYEFIEDSDQPGMWLWMNNTGEASDISFHTRKEAEADALRHASGKPVPTCFLAGKYESQSGKVKYGLKTCPHCFDVDDEANFVFAAGDGVYICSQCADGSAVWAALAEWRGSGSPRTFDLWMLESFGYEVIEDPNKPGAWLLLNIKSAEAQKLNIIKYFRWQLAEGLIRPEDLAEKFVLYGLMDPAEFMAEMTERIEMVKEDL